MEQETVTEVDGTINNIVYIMENPVEKERWMNLKSENESLKVQLLQQRTYTPPANEEQAEVQKLLKLVERLKHENQEKQISIEQYQLELIESQNTNRKLKTEYASVQSRYQSSQQELQAEKLESDKLRKEVEDLTKENLKFKNDAILFEKKHAQVVELFDLIKLENRSLEVKLAEKAKFEEDIKKRNVEEQRVDRESWP